MGNYILLGIGVYNVIFAAVYLIGGTPILPIDVLFSGIAQILLGILIILITKIAEAGKK